MQSDLEYLRPFATPYEDRVLDLLAQGMTYQAAAAEMGCAHRSSICNALARLRARAALNGVAPEHSMNKRVPDNFAIKRVSTLWNRDEKHLQWVISEPRREALLEAMRGFMEALAESIPPAPMVPAPMHTEERLLAVVPMGDPHFGMRAWEREAGENFDLKIADQLTRAAIDRLVQAIPPARRALLLNLGDFFHADDNRAMTPEHGNKLDVDGRYDLVLTTGAMCMVYCIQRLLERHETVEVWNLPGNHDPHAALALSLGLQMFFHDNPRVSADVNPSRFRYLQHGRCLIAATHGDGLKLPDLPGILATDRPLEWGTSLHRVWHTGHVHHDQVKDFRGCVVETHRTLAASDAWATGKGYRAPRDIKAIVYDKDDGELARLRVSPGMLRRAGELT